ncbi:MAG: hypothetical protein HY226_02255 [Candidatus Vogelbacteria bacterium]|nr:hypothetical protein [Candidatus Vogelbacteria bacterium]
MKIKTFLVNLWKKALDYKEIAINIVCGLLMLSLIFDLCYGEGKAGLGIFTLIINNLGLCLTPQFYISVTILGTICLITRTTFLRFIFMAEVLWVVCLTKEFYLSPYALATNCLVANILWFHFVLALTLWLGKINRIFNWSWLGMNINLLPLLKRYLGPIFVVLLMLDLPSITGWEEYVFRVGITNWHMGIANSILFGFAHCVIGIPLGAGIALIGLGLWLDWCYFMAGPIFIAPHAPPMFDPHVFATMNHTTFNLVGCFMMLYFLIKRHIELAKN